MKYAHLQISPQHTLKDALAVIDAGECQLALVTENGRLVGVVADGDIRRAILRGSDLHLPVTSAMNTKPVAVRLSEGQGTALLRLRENFLRHIPVLDDNGLLCDLWSLEYLLNFTALPYPVVIMAGGLGSRLSPLTDDIAKPMLPIGGQPLLKLIMEHFRGQGFRQFYVSVNYKAETITDYFGNGSTMGISIAYIHEGKRLGTAGALSLLPRFELPCVVMNGDILTRLNFAALVESHQAKRASATLVIKKHAIQVPYGVVHHGKDGCLERIEEKPEHSFFISTGINVLSPDVLDLVPRDSFFDMPDLFNLLLRQGRRPCTYEMQEYWLDIGRISDYQRASEEWQVLRGGE